MTRHFLVRVNSRQHCTKLAFSSPRLSACIPCAATAAWATTCKSLNASNPYGPYPAKKRAATAQYPECRHRHRRVRHCNSSRHEIHHCRLRIRRLLDWSRERWRWW